MTDPAASLQRAFLLYQQHRLKEAEEETRRVLATEGESVEAHTLLSYLLLERDDLRGATEEAERAIALGPNLASPHIAHAQTLYARNRYDDALASIETALALDPQSASAFGVKGSIHLQKKEYEPALDAAESGLALDPDDAHCQSLRTLALERLGRGEEALLASDEALRKDPDNADAHAMAGVAAMSAGNHTAARDHFREALRLNPNHPLARDGMIRALNARNFLFRWMFKYFNWMSRLGSRAQWGIILGAWLLIQILGDVAERNPAVQPFITPLIFVYVLFALLTWIVNPLFNSFLRLNPYGRYLLNRDQLQQSNWSLVNLAVGVGLMLAVPFAFPNEGLTLCLLIGLAHLMLLLPITGIFACDPGWPRTVMIVVTGVLFALELYALTMLKIGEVGYAGAAVRVFFFTAIGSQFLANYLAGVVVRK